MTHRFNHATTDFIFKKLDARQSMTVAHPAIPSRRRLLVIVDSSVNWASSAALALLVVSCRTRVSRKCLRVDVQRKCPFTREAMSVPQCIGVVNRNRRRSTSCITLTTVARVVDDCTKFMYYTLITVTNKKLRYRRGTARCIVSVEICQLPRNSAETTCMTNPEQIEVMKLKRYNKAMCNKHVHSTMTRSSRFRCPLGVINKPTTVELWISPVYRGLSVAKFSKSTM